MKIITKFVGSSAAVLGLIICLIGGSTIILSKAERSVESSRIQTQKALEKVIYLEFTLFAQVASLKDYLFLNYNSIDIATYQKYKSQFLITLDELEHLNLCQEEIDVIRRRHQKLAQLANSLQYSYSNNFEIQQDVRAINSFNKDIQFYIKTLVEESEKAHQTTLQKANRNRHLSNKIQYSIVVLVLLIFIIHFKLIILPIFNSINQLNLGVVQIGKGDFKSRLNIKTQDEIEQLANNFNNMADKLDKLYQNIDQKIKLLNQTNQNLEEEINYRKTVESQLQQTLKDLQKAQSQLIQTEKMSSLGQMVAGIAHEINNPVSFIHGNLDCAKGYSQDLLHLIELYQEYYPEPVEDIQIELEELDIDFLKKDFTLLMNSMKMGTERIRDIVKSLRTFSRLDEADLKEVDLHEGIESTLMILQHRLKATANHPEIEIIKQYGELPLVNCYSGQLNQVFMNILSNAIDVLQETNINPPQITIQTQFVKQNYIKIIISDNGSGIPEKIQDKLFDPFFTTKAIGQGTGLGLSICYQIIVDRHDGKIDCNSTLGKGTEFIIEIPIKRGDNILDASVA